MITLRSVDRVYPLKGGPFYALRNISLASSSYPFLNSFL